MATPSEELATRIGEELAREGIITEEQVVRLVGRMAGGTLSPEDWRFELERAAPEVQR